MTTFSITLATFMNRKPNWAERFARIAWWHAMCIWWLSPVIILKPRIAHDAGGREADPLCWQVGKTKRLPLEGRLYIEPYPCQWVICLLLVMQNWIPYRLAWWMIQRNTYGQVAGNGRNQRGILSGFRPLVLGPGIFVTWRAEKMQPGCGKLF